jgi:hypothetical protein
MEPQITPPQGEPIVPITGQTSKEASRKQTSQKKIDANRRNSLRSTGPKTRRGKGAVALNAVKHGLLAKQAVITRGDGAEDVEEFNDLLQGLRQDNQPVGMTEELLVEKIAICWWKLARALRHEMGQIRKRLDNVGVTQVLEQEDKSNLELWLHLTAEQKCFYAGGKKDELPPLNDWLPIMQGLQSKLRTKPAGIQYLKHVLATTKLEIQTKGYVSEQNQKMLLCAIGFCDQALFMACLSLTQSPKDGKMEGAPEESSEKGSLARREYVLDLIDQRAELLEWLGERAEVNQLLEVDAEARSLVLPDEAAANKLLRYETHLDRQLYRAMDELERRQRRRKGENVPPPLNVNLGRRE